MTDVIAVLTPVFVTVLIGYLMARMGWAEPAMMQAVNAFAINIAVPALVFRMMAIMPFEDLLNIPFLLTWAFSSILLFLVGGLLGQWLEGRVRGAIAVRGQVCAVGNTAFLAVAVLVDFIGPRAATPITMALLVDLMIMVPAGIAFFEHAKGEGGGLSAFIKAVGNALRHPFILTIIAGLLWSLSGWKIPQMADATLTFIGNAASPAALFAMGLSLHFLQVGSGHTETFTLALIKVIVHPALVALVGYLIGVTPFLLACAVLIAAMPTAGHIFIFAQQYNIYAGRAASVIVVSTVISVVTLSLLMWQLGDIVASG